MSPSCSRRRSFRALAAVVLALQLSGCSTPVLGVDDEKRMGDELRAELLKDPRVIKDPLVRDYIEDLGNRILAAAGPQPFDYNFFVLDDPIVNAFAAHGGNVVVFTGLILAVENVSELAAVMGHEVGHASLRHLARSHYRRQGTGILATVFGSLLQIGLGGYGGAGGAIVTDLIAQAYLNSYTRDDEREADVFAIQVLPEAGIHPIGLATFFETMEQEGGGADPPAFLSSHPSHEERIETARKMIAEHDIGGDLILEDDGRLEIIQRRIELLTGR